MKYTLMLMVIGITNFVAQNWIFRIDLTEDKRYTISDATKEILENLNDEIRIKVYLEGENLPASYRMFRNTIAENLGEFKRYAGKNLKFKFIDPLAVKDKAEKDTLIKNFQKKGITPTPISVYKEGERSEKFIFPAAEISYKDLEITVPLIKSDAAAQAVNEEVEARLLNSSIENIEYSFISAIKQITDTTTHRVGFIYGHGELALPLVADAARTLSQKYAVYPVDLPKSPSLDGLDAIIIAKPDSTFSEDDKYKIDQFLMKGGKALFFVDALDIREDSINTKEGAVAIPYTEFVQSMTPFFFNLGVRFEMNFIEDVQNFGFLGFVVGNYGDKPKLEVLPWRHYLSIRNYYPHPVVKNLEPVLGRYVSTLDTVASASEIKKIPLASSSAYTRVVPYPVIIKYEEARETPDMNIYKKGKAETVMFLLEGQFTSFFAKRILPSDPRAKTFINKGKPTKVLVCADGDFLRNSVNPKTGQIAPLGYDKYSRYQFANKQFLLNMLDYMLDDDGIILARNKEISLRPLDKKKLQTKRTYWQFINVAMPLVLVILFGIVWVMLRKRKYTK
ncbi:MAG: gliding motility-associated ABC transporter substrate-binding protein GldG [Raineya sp.]|nr:gliding motility-associated ABC transporter substrate-binding protein GldG [Raineya sp.]